MGGVKEIKEEMAMEAPEPRPPEPPCKDFDEMLKHVGGFGTYQKRLIFFALPFNLVLTAVYFGHSFLALTPEHWCKVPELMDLDMEERKNISIPLEHRDGGYQYSRCRVYDVNFTEMMTGVNLSESREDWPTTSCRHGWEYDLTRDYGTIVSELDWVCDDAWRPNLAQSIFFVGSVIGSLIFGALGDHFGRRPVLFVSNLVALAGGIFTSLSNSFLTFVIARFVVGLTYYNCFMAMYIIMVEYVKPNKRSLVANLPIALFLTTGLAVLPWLGYGLWNWRILGYVICIPSAFICLVGPWIIPESGRWLLSKGKVDKAEDILRHCARLNKREVDEKVYEEFRDYARDFAEKEKSQEKHNLLEIFKYPTLRRRVILLIIQWMSLTVCYDGHVRNLENLKAYMSLYLCFSLMGLLEFPGDMLTIYALEHPKAGRRLTYLFSLGASGVFSLLVATLPLDQGWAKWAVLGFAAGGRFCVTMAMNTGLQYCVEVLPTQLRGQGVNLVHIAGHFATLASPLIVYLGNFSMIIPFIALGFIGIIGGSLSLCLPETLGRTLPNTAQEAEVFRGGAELCMGGTGICGMEVSSDTEVPGAV
ncbi:solute carrier family 22 member 21-like isoform X2 [Ischnura elegans]|uniref:solute carrier family 22 member 21-like isoform X2 n=1 Tax=Ischnura elegans TaxID=197161 RepID=UPI001ED88369|nr:solute carrier family 22 member 21-like isoform X2 [Ischnura elegans]